MSWNIEVVTNSLGGIQRLYKFSNGLYLSAVQNSMSYGNREYMGEKGQWEIAVIDSDGNWKTKDIFQDATDDVIGRYLSRCYR